MLLHSQKSHTITLRKLSFDTSKFNLSNLDTSKLNISNFDTSKLNISNFDTGKMIDSSIEQLIETTKLIENKLIEKGLSDTDISVGINIGIISVSINKKIKNDQINVE